MRTFLLGLILQLVPFPLFALWGVTYSLPEAFHPENLNPWIVLGGLGTLGAVLTFTGGVLVRGAAGVVTAGVSLIGLLGWGSWLLVGIQHSIDEPVINVTGILVVISTIGLVLVAAPMGVWRMLTQRGRPAPPAASAG